MGGTVCARGVKKERERVKEFRIDELRNKDTSCLYDQTEQGTPFFGRLFQKVMYAYISDLWVK